MRYLIISDIHANLAAFEKVLKDAEGKYDRVWCLGDMVGYGPDPNESVELLNTLDKICIAGNHDWAALAKLDVNDFNPDARFAALWTRENLKKENYDYLNNLPVAMVEEDRFTLVHGSPRHPIWEYLLYPAVAHPNFGHFTTDYCFVGHTHSPVIFQASEVQGELCQAIVPMPNNGPVPIAQQRVIINPGSVGQPRDGDARASYAILDADTLSIEHRRVEYDIKATQDKMRVLGFPARLINRLEFGW